MRRLTGTVGLTLVALALTGCGGSDEPAGPDWSNYPPGKQKQIDDLGAAKKCDELQRQFDMADKHAALMEYVDQTMRDAGCY